MVRIRVRVGICVGLGLALPTLILNLFGVLSYTIIDIDLFHTPLRA